MGTVLLLLKQSPMFYQVHESLSSGINFVSPLDGFVCDVCLFTHENIDDSYSWETFESHNSSHWNRQYGKIPTINFFTAMSNDLPTQISERRMNEPV